MIDCFVFDIDGTVADTSHRQHFLEKTPKDWKGFFGACSGDAPIVPLRTIINALALVHGPWSMVYVSGRSEDLRTVTRTWLLRHGFPDLRLFMRGFGDFRDDAIVKRELLDRMRTEGLNPIFAFDDRSRVVKMWRDAGIPCAQVAEGDF